MVEYLWFGGWLLAALVLFNVGVSLPALCLSLRSKLIRAVAIAGSLGALVGVTVLANMALTRHDAHFDLTREQVFTPNRDALAVVERLDRPVRLTYFYREDDAQGRRARHIVELMSHRSRYLEVRIVDPDRHPSLARSAGVKLYNTALLEADGRRVIVRSTDESDIALGIQRVLREQVVEICFLTGHGEYPSDNYEFHTHVEGLGGGHGHGADSAIVATTRHGVGRFRRALEALGYETREITPAIDGTIASDCRMVIDAGPRTAYSEIESAALLSYLESGGAALLLYDLNFVIAPAHARLLRRFGMVLQDAIVVDPALHYASDPEMVAVTAYEPHAVTRRMSFTFYPGARPIELFEPSANITVASLFSSSKKSYSEVLTTPMQRLGNDADHDQAMPSKPRPHVLAAASIGRLSGHSSRSFRVVVVGDCDFLSNSFYPYMSNNRLALAMVRWLVDEAGNVPVAARIPVPQTVVLTNRQQHVLLLLLVGVLPLTVGGIGIWVWWYRR